MTNFKTKLSRVWIIGKTKIISRLDADKLTDPEAVITYNILENNI